MKQKLSTFLGIWTCETEGKKDDEGKERKDFSNITVEIEGITKGLFTLLKSLNYCFLFMKSVVIIFKYKSVLEKNYCLTLEELCTQLYTIPSCQEKTTIL